MKRTAAVPVHSALELDGHSYVVLRLEVFEELCRRARVGAPKGDVADELPVWLADPSRLGRRLSDRRRRLRLTQAGLATSAGIRVETLNRIERGRTTPDFRTVRKLVTALRAAEAAAAREESALDDGRN